MASQKLKSSALLLVILVSYAGCIDVRDKDPYQKVLLEAEKNQINILLDFTAVWCGGCKAYDKYVFSVGSIEEKINAKFILYKIDRDSPDNQDLVDKYKIVGLPHIVIIDFNEQILGSIMGFDRQYQDHPELFSSQLDSILDAQEKLQKLESEFYTDTTDINGINNLMAGYKSVGHYLGIQKLEKLLVTLHPTSENVFEYSFSQAVNAIRNDLNPDPLLLILKVNPELDHPQEIESFSRLLYYYQATNNVEKEQYYYQKLIKISPDYFSKQYARFLFENDLEIDSAICITNQSLLDEKFRDDHWGQFLKAHSLVYLGDTTRAIMEYKDWMQDNQERWNSGETYWPLYFYARFANFHSIDLKQAFEFIQIAEEKRNMIDEKILMAEILVKLGEYDHSIAKLEESLIYADNKMEYEKITGLIEKHKHLESRDF